MKKKGSRRKKVKCQISILLLQSSIKTTTVSKHTEKKFFQNVNRVAKIPLSIEKKYDDDYDGAYYNYSSLSIVCTTT